MCKDNVPSCILEVRILIVVFHAYQKYEIILFTFVWKAISYTWFFYIILLLSKQCNKGDESILEEIFNYFREVFKC